MEDNDFFKDRNKGKTRDTKKTIDEEEKFLERTSADVENIFEINDVELIENTSEESQRVKRKKFFEIVEAPEVFQDLDNIDEGGNPVEIPIIDLTQHIEHSKKHVVCKLPQNVYNKVLKLVQEKVNQDKNKGNKEFRIKGNWTHDEDTILIDLVNKHGPKKWSWLATHLKGRIGKQCRERWLNHLDPSIKKSDWSEEEDNLIVKLHKENGNQWSKISKHFSLKGRTPNMIKNRWNSTLKKKTKGYKKKKKRGYTRKRDAVRPKEVKKINENIQLNKPITSSQIIINKNKKEKKEK